MNTSFGAVRIARKIQLYLALFLGLGGWYATFGRSSPGGPASADAELRLNPHTQDTHVERRGLPAMNDDSAGVRLVFVGDIMLADGPGEAIARGVNPFAEFESIFRNADAVIGNLECVVAKCGEPVDKPFTFRADPRVAPLLARYFASVSLANNHTGDFGSEAFVEQLAFLRQRHIAYFGGGANCAEARRPVIIERRGLRIALLGYNDFQPRDFEAGPDWPGIAWCVDEQIVADIHAARSLYKADLVIPFMHWGEEHEPANERQQKLARMMIDEGADLVVGGHPHVTQGAEY